jgi:hypothetical protein
MQISTQQATPPTTSQAPRPPISITTIETDAQGRTISGTITLPRTQAEIQELLTQREELSEQLTGVSSRRRNLAEEISQTRDASIRAGLEDRLRVLDARILQLETDLATTGRQLSSAPAELLQSRQVEDSPAGHFEEGLVIGGLGVLFAAAVAFLFLRRRWKRPTSRTSNQLGADAGQRLERLEQGMDAIAIEIERVSEGQRFVTRLLSEAQSPAGVGRIAEPAAVKSDPARRG